MKIRKRIILLFLFFIVGLSFLNLKAEEVGSLEGEAYVEQGTLNYGIPLETPSGPNGMSPPLSVSYLQNGINGPLGIGFTIKGLSSVSRCSATEEIEGYRGRLNFKGETFYCFEGKRLVKISNSKGAGIYQTYPQSHAHIIAYGSPENPDYWEVKQKNGFIYFYGIDANSKEITDQGIVTWRLSAEKDRFENTINYRYRSDQGVLDEVEYGIHKIVFNYENRPDVFEGFLLGKKKTLSLRLKEISIQINHQELRKYSLTYEQVGAKNLSRLQSITVCDPNDECIKPTVFGWKTNQIPDISSIQTSDALSIPSTNSKDQQIADISVTKQAPVLKNVLPANDFVNYVVGDLNKDGLNDICYLQSGLYCAVNQGGGNYDQAKKWSEDFNGGKWNKIELAATLNLMDINRDSFTDFCSIDKQGVFCGINSEGSFFEEGTYWSTNYSLDDTVRFIDLNLDRYIDICKFTTEGIFCSLNNKNAFGEIFLLLNNEHYNAVDGENKTLTFMDINKDGLQDICGSDAENQFFCSLRTTTKDSDSYLFEEEVLWAENMNWKNSRFKSTLRFVDLNIDGYVDVCYREESKMMCRFNDGTKFLDAKEWFVFDEQWDNETNYTLSIIDINEDAYPDLCGVIGSNSFICAENRSDRFENATEYLAVLGDYEKRRVKKSKAKEVLSIISLPTKYEGISVSIKYGPLKLVSDIDGKEPPIFVIEAIKAFFAAFFHRNL